MKINYFITLAVIVGVAALFFFPEPETNFLAYVGTALFFIVLIVFLIWWKRKKRKRI